MGIERRTDERVDFRAKVALRFQRDEVVDTYSINLSVGGLSIELPEAPDVGAAVAVHLELSDGFGLDLDGVVRHTTTITVQGFNAGRSAIRTLVGIQFRDVKPEHVELIKSALEQQEAD